MKFLAIPLACLVFLSGCNFCCKKDSCCQTEATQTTTEVTQPELDAQAVDQNESMSDVSQETVEDTAENTENLK